MPRGGKRKGGTPKHEVEEAAERMKKHPEYLRAAKNSGAWLDFLDSIGIDTINTGSGQAFWEDVRLLIPNREIIRKNKYQEARDIGISSKLARRLRDFSQSRFDMEIEKWKSKY